MSRCPFWSSKNNRVNCSSDCPMLYSEEGNLKDSEECIFKECSSQFKVNFKGILKDEYKFWNSSVCDDDNRKIINY